MTILAVFIRPLLVLTLFLSFSINIVLLFKCIIYTINYIKLKVIEMNTIFYYD
jgi:hypothetical protein